MIKLLVGNFSMFPYTILINIACSKCIDSHVESILKSLKRTVNESTNVHVKQIVVVELALNIHLSWTFLLILISITHTISLYVTQLQYR